METHQVLGRLSPHFDGATTQYFGCSHSFIQSSIEDRLKTYRNEGGWKGWLALDYHGPSVRQVRRETRIGAYPRLSHPAVRFVPDLDHVFHCPVSLHYLYSATCASCPVLLDITVCALCERACIKTRAWRSSHNSQQTQDLERTECCSFQ